MLNLASVLIVEDEPFIALCLANAVEDAGGSVVGPVGSVREALVKLETSLITAAILDTNLTDRDIYPAAEILLTRGIPVIFHTAVGVSIALQARFPDLVVCIKPCDAEELVTQLATLIANRERSAPARLSPLVFAA